MTGKHATFDQIMRQMNVMYMGEFLRFWSDFDFKLPKTKLAEIFKRSSYSSRELSFEEFVKMLALLKKEQNSHEARQLKKKYREI